MTIKKQLNLLDRTLILGVCNFDKIPDIIVCKNQEIKVIGVSHGIKLPYISLEIEKTNLDLIGKKITNKMVK